MPTFKLDGHDIPFEPGDTIIKAAWRQGIEIPHYCWHPGLSAPANCRMCLVELLPKPGRRAMMLDVLEWDPNVGDYRPRQKPKLQPACYTPAAEGLEVLSDASQNVVEARKAVQVITADGERLSGGRALLFALRETGWHPELIRLLRHRPFVWAVDIGYRVVAANRPFVSRFVAPN